MFTRGTITLLAAALIASCFPANSQAQGTVQIDAYCGGNLNFSHSHSASNPISEILASCTDYVYITPSSSSVNMPRITLTGGPSFACRIALGATFDTAANPPTMVGNNWNGLDASGITESAFYGGINGSLNGSILVKSLYRFDAGNAVSAAITANRTASLGNPCIVEADSISSRTLQNSAIW